MAKKQSTRRKDSRDKNSSPVAKGEPPAVEKAPESPVETAPDVPELTIVGIGASAGGLEAFSQLLEALPDDPGLALVFVQHLSPQHESSLAQLLSAKTTLPVVQVTEGMPVEANHVYVIPPNVQMELADQKLHLVPREPSAARNMPVDFFFRSLAERLQNRAVGVVLSGTASDGAQGLREIKAVGGITFCQDPQTAKYDGMPQAAVATEAVDLVLPVEQIAQELVRIARHPYVTHIKPRRPGDDFIITEEQLHHVFTLLRKASGVDFAQYKQPTIRRRLQRRMVLHKLTSVDQYLRYLQQNPAEINNLYSDILIHVTRFFRDPESFDVLAENVFPPIIENRSPDAPLRVWVPGCSTGEEAYSIAICLLEFLGERARSVPIQIFGTDLSEAAIEYARAALYPETIAGDVSAERLRRFFTKTNDNFQVGKAVRELCVFAKQDLTRDPPFSKLDLIVCRNVLIYLSLPLQKRLLTVFHYALKPNGFLLLGAAESIGPQADLFTLAHKKHKIYAKKQMLVRPEVEFLPTRVAPPLELQKKGDDLRKGRELPNRVDQILLRKYAPAAVVVDNSFRIVEVRGQTGRFLEPAPGEATLDVLKMAREGLVHPLRAALHDARKNKTAARKERVGVKFNGHDLRLNLEVVPLDPNRDGGLFLIIFEEVARPEDVAEQKKPAAGGKRRAAKRTEEAAADGETVERLQDELADTREYLQSIIQDLESANEELQSANEEILSSNEELQSINEELDTAKEELQSTNEELNTVNDELRARNEELGRANSDLVNLLGSVQIAIVMVDRGLRIRRFTPMAERVLNVIPGDMGRPISHLKPNIEIPDLEERIKDVIDTVTPYERDVQDRQGSWYSLRIRPYRDLENRIDGAVLALFDVDAARRIGAELRAARDFAEAIVETVREPLVVLDAQLRVQRVNQAFCRRFQISAADAKEKKILELADGQWMIPELQARLEDVLVKEESFEEFAVERDFPHVGRKRLLMNARRLVGDDEREPLILLAIELDEHGRNP